MEDDYRAIQGRKDCRCARSIGGTYADLGESFRKQKNVIARGETNAFAIAIPQSRARIARQGNGGIKAREFGAELRCAYFGCKRLA